MTILAQYDFDDFAATDITVIDTELVAAGFRASTTSKWRNGAYAHTGAGGLSQRQGLKYYTGGSQTTLGLTMTWRKEIPAPVSVKRIVDFVNWNDPTETLQLRIQANLENGIEARRNDNTLVAKTAPMVFRGNEKYTIQIKVTCSNTVGKIDIKVDHVTVLSTSANLDTQSHASSDVINEYQWGDLGNEPNIDNLILWDTAGGTDFFDPLPECFGLDADGDGDVSAWTPTSGSNWQNVDENVPDGDTTIVETDTVTNQDLYTLENLPAVVDTVYAVSAVVTARETASGTNDIQILQKLSATTVKSATKTLTTSYERHAFLREVDPSGGAWSVADVNSLQIGQELV